MKELLGQDKLFINQIKEWTEILVNIETKNAYEIKTESDQVIGNIAEISDGLFGLITRMLFRSHRPLNIKVVTNAAGEVLNFNRKFFFFFSDLLITDKQGRELGSVHRRFGILNKKYDLQINGRTFATVKSPMWRLWTFPIYDKYGESYLGVITKKWQGLIKEGFTDADKFLVDYGTKDWSLEQKAVILGLAISIDFDFFEDNQKNN